MSNVLNWMATCCPRTKLLAGALLLAGGVGGWAIATSVDRAVAVESRYEVPSNNAVDNSKLGLVGTYVVTGTDPEGRPYGGVMTLDISLVPSGALELSWDNGKIVGIGQRVDDALAVSYLVNGRSVISVMHINADGSLSGQWLRRADRGFKGTETWRKKR
jgi:hypothetical protein